MDAHSSAASRSLRKRSVSTETSGFDEKCKPANVRMRTHLRENTPAQQLTCVERLQAVNGVVKSVDDILGELFPYQNEYRQADRLVSPPSRTPFSVECGTPHTAAVSRGATRKKRLAVSSPLQSIQMVRTPSSVQAPSSSPKTSLRRQNRPIQVRLDEPSALHEQNQHTLALWEDKFRGRRLSPQDILFLLTHEDAVSVLESASLLREARLTYDQLMELEMTLESLHKERSAVPCFRLCELLCHSVWVRGVAFEAPVSERSNTPATCSPRKTRLAPLSPAKTRTSDLPAMERVSTSPVLQNPSKSRKKSTRRLRTALPYDHTYTPSKQNLARRDDLYEHRLVWEAYQQQSNCQEEQHRRISTLLKMYLRFRCDTPWMFTMTLAGVL